MNRFYVKILLPYALIAGNTFNASAHTDTAIILFPFNSSTLTAEALRHMDSLFTKEFFNKAEKINIIGFADYVGRADANKILSRNRATTVWDSLRRYWLPAESLSVEAFGTARSKPDTFSTGRATDRRVVIVVQRGPEKKNTVKRPPAAGSAKRVAIFNGIDPDNAPGAALEFMDSTNAAYLQEGDKQTNRRIIRRR